MSKYNTKSSPEMAVNEMGELAYVMPEKENLVSSVLTTFMTRSYYETEDEAVAKIKAAADGCDPLFVAKTAIYARQTANMRSSSHFLAAILADRASGTEWGRRFYERIVVRPDDISEILACYNIKQNALPNAMRKGFKKALEKFDIYQLDKYKMTRKSISLIDLFNLLHPKASGKKAEAYADIIKNRGKNLHTMYESRILEKEMTAAGQKQGDALENKAQAIKAVLESPKGMPVFNLLRNLRNIFLYAPEMIGEACEQLNQQEKIRNSRLLPFRFASAYTEIEKLSYGRTNHTQIAFESDKQNLGSEDEFNNRKQQLLDAIEGALEISCQNIECLDGNTAILVDHSGSVRGDAGGDSRVSQFSKTTCAAIGNLFGAMLAYKQNDVYLGLFGDRLIAQSPNRSERMLDFARRSYAKGAECGPSTENGLYIFLKTCIKEKKHIDNLVIFSDMVIGKDGSGGWDETSNVRRGEFERLFKEFRKINPQCRTVCVNIRSTSGKSVFNYRLGVLEIAGWSNAIFDTIQNNSKGYQAIIDEIEAIVL